MDSRAGGGKLKHAVGSRRVVLAAGRPGPAVLSDSSSNSWGAVVYVVEETPRLILREFTGEDLPALTTILGDPRVMRFSVSGPLSRDAVAQFLQRSQAVYAEHGCGLWAVVERATHELLGYCGLVWQEVDGQPELEVGYRLAPAWWGRGIATEAALAARDHALVRLGRNRLIALIDPANGASRRVAEKLGMHLEKETTFREIRVQVFALAHTSPKR